MFQPKKNSWLLPNSLLFLTTQLSGVFMHSLYFLTCLINPLQSIFNSTTPKIICVKLRCLRNKANCHFYFLIDLLFPLSFKGYTYSLLKNNFFFSFITTFFLFPYDFAGCLFLVFLFCCIFFFLSGGIQISSKSHFYFLHNVTRESHSFSLI